MPFQEGVRVVSASQVSHLALGQQ